MHAYRTARAGWHRGGIAHEKHVTDVQKSQMMSKLPHVAVEAAKRLCEPGLCGEAPCLPESVEELIVLQPQFGHNNAGSTPISTRSPE